MTALLSHAPLGAGRAAARPAPGPRPRARGLVALARAAAAEELARLGRERATAGESLRRLRLGIEVDAVARRLARLARIEAALASLEARADVPRATLSLVGERVRWIAQVRDAADLEGLAHEVERLARAAAHPRRDGALAAAAAGLTGRVQAEELRAAALADVLARTPDPVAIARAAASLDATLRAMAICLRLRDHAEALADLPGLAPAARASALALLAEALRPVAPDQLARLASEAEAVAA